LGQLNNAPGELDEILTRGRKRTAAGLCEREENLTGGYNETSVKENLLGGDNEIEPRECEARARRKIEKLATTKSGTREREEKLEACAKRPRERKARLKGKIGR
jgi:hypothetical protein